tara:strand:+ start:1311 stop:1727 length:417 start_codon:yes stop_codon:yes gene_type:complete
MIKYRLICKNCNVDFDSWFASSNEYEKLKSKKLLTCLSCNSTKVEKNLMAPKLINTKNEKEIQKFKDVKRVVRNYQNFIKENFEYVGDKFTYEARSIHYNNKKKDKGIYGTASKKDLDELREEGIEAQVLPWIEDKSN